MEEYHDFPKIESPLVRKTFAVNRDDYKKYKKEYPALRRPELFLVVPEVAPGMEWVFENDDVIMTEKLDGTNVAISVTDEGVVAMRNRKNKIPWGDHNSMTSVRFTKAVLEARALSFINMDKLQSGEWIFGEVIGPSVQTNPLGLNRIVWIPFETARSRFKYNHNIRRTDHSAVMIAGIDEYLTYCDAEETRKHPEPKLWSRLVNKCSRLLVDPDTEDPPLAEGVVFYSPRRHAEGKHPYMAKLRRDMFRRHYPFKVIDYPTSKQGVSKMPKPLNEETEEIRKRISKTYFVCRDCGSNYGRGRVPMDLMESVHDGICPICKKENAMLYPVRVFGYLDPELFT